MDAPTNLHQLTVFLPAFERITKQNRSDANQTIKAAGKNDLRIMLISRYPLKLTENPNTKSMTELVREVERVSLNFKRIIERVGDSN